MWSVDEKDPSVVMGELIMLPMYAHVAYADRRNIQPDDMARRWDTMHQYAPAPFDSQQRLMEHDSTTSGMNGTVKSEIKKLRGERMSRDPKYRKA